MTFPTVVEVKRGQSNSDLLARSVQLPTVTAGQTLLAFFAVRSGATVTWDNDTAGEWSPVDSTAYSSYVGLHVFKKICDGSESGLSLSINTNIATRAVWHIYRLSEATGEIAAGAAVTGNDRVANPPNCAPPWGADDVLWITTVAIRDPTATPSTPSNYDNRQYDDTGGNLGLASARRSLNASSQNPGDWTLSPFSTSRRFITNTYAIRGGIVALQPPRLNIAVTPRAPQLNLALAAPRLDIAVTPLAPSVGYDQELEAPLLEIELTFPQAKIITGVGPPPLLIDLQVYAPEVRRELHNVEPPRLDIEVKLRRPLVTGGTRVTPVFDKVSIGPFPGAVADVELIQGSSAGAAFQTRWNIRGPVGFGDFAPFVAGEYEFQSAVIWMRLTVEAVERIFAITRAKLNIDVPDVIDRGEAEIAEGGQYVTFNRGFYQPPEVVAQVVAADGVITVPRVTVRDDIETGRFFATIHFGDDLDDSVDGKIKWIATGY